MMAQLAPQGVKGERGKVLAGKKVRELSLITAGEKCRGRWFQMPQINL